MSRKKTLDAKGREMTEGRKNALWNTDVENKAREILPEGTEAEIFALASELDTQRWRGHYYDFPTTATA